VALIYGHAGIQNGNNNLYNSPAQNIISNGGSYQNGVSPYLINGNNSNLSGIMRRNKNLLDDSSSQGYQVRLPRIQSLGK
jgi:hypothetical protein